VSKEDLIKQAAKALLDGDEDAAVEVANKVIEEGINPVEMINKGFTPGMIEMGNLFNNEEISLPEVLLAAEAMQKAIDIMEPHIPKEQAVEKLGTVVIGTIAGDNHDIGKNIVAAMFRVYGFEVEDLGRDVPIKNFIEKAKELNADIVASSALMTTTMQGQRLLEEGLSEAGIREDVKTMVGGAAVTQEWADKIGADGYAEDVNEGVIKAKELIR
jgi:trimethylamine corrinoid protein